MQSNIFHSISSGTEKSARVSPEIPKGEHLLFKLASSQTQKFYHTVGVYVVCLLL